MRAQAAAARDTGPLPDCPRKALYLATATPVYVSSAGASLIVQHESGPRRQFPLTRIDRVICNRNAQWTGDALLLCLLSGLRVTWVDGRGRAVGDATPARIVPMPLAERIESYLEQPQWPACYGNWLRCRRLAVLNRWAARQRAEGRGCSRRRFEELKRAYVYCGESWSFDEEYAGWCHALALAQLAREGLCKRYWGYGGQALDLSADLTDLLCAELALSSGSLPAAVSASAAVRLLFFERWTDAARHILVEHLGDLRRHIAREIS